MRLPAKYMWHTNYRYIVSCDHHIAGTRFVHKTILYAQGQDTKFQQIDFVIKIKIVQNHGDLN